MIPGETITITLPGMFQADDTTIELYPQDLSAACVSASVLLLGAGASVQHTFMSSTLLSVSDILLSMSSTLFSASDILLSVSSMLLTLL